LRLRILIPVFALLLGCGGVQSNESFLSDNAKREGVQTTPSGLQYEVLRDGSGPKPRITDTVTVHYKGTLIDGTVFDSSYDRNQPATFPLMQVVPGWRQGIPPMPVGSKYKLYIPPDLGYGSQDKGTIPPNSVLIFEVELLGIEGH
jgi:FKBP-type peptidyl-prolyl cis-trans isomerase FkpA